MLAMAAGTLPSTEQQRLEDLMQSDPESRLYWESLKKLARTLKDDASRDVPNLPLGFHTKLLSRLDDSPSSPMSWFAEGLGFIAKPLVATAIILLLGLAIKTGLPKQAAPEKASTQASQVSSASSVVEATSWAALRAATTDPTPLLASIPQDRTEDDCPSMAWADREHWIEHYDL